MSWQCRLVHSGKWKFIPFILLLPLSVSAYKKSYSLLLIETSQLFHKLSRGSIREIRFPSNILPVKTLIFPIPFSRWPFPSSHDMERLLDQLFAYLPSFPNTSLHLCQAPPSPLAFVTPQDNSCCHITPSS